MDIPEVVSRPSSAPSRYCADLFSPVDSVADFITAARAVLLHPTSSQPCVSRREVLDGTSSPRPH